MLEKRQAFIDDLMKGDQRTAGVFTKGDNFIYFYFDNVTYTDDLAMEVEDQVVHAYVTAGAATITLPSVKEARGKVYSIWAMDGTGSMAVEDKAGDAGLTDITLDATGEHTLLYSDGFHWYEICKGWA